MYIKRTFTAKFGDPRAFIFKTQVWDSRLASDESSHRQCWVCHRKVRFVFILKKLQIGNLQFSPEIGKLEIGACCFHYFRRWNNPLYQKLKHGYKNAITYARAIDRDKKVNGPRASLQMHAANWRVLRGQIVARLRAMRNQNAIVPMGDILKLQELIDRRPLPYKRSTSAIRWYSKQMTELQEGMQKLSQ